ncbi:MAG: putative RNA uridine N3 methyltransferase [Candidatus Hodarchaeales archaeon]
MKLTIAIPDSAVTDCNDIRTKTEKIFQIARIAAIFKIQHILIYHDPYLKPKEAYRERRKIKRILEYIECPQYLRKKLFPISRDTAAVGVLSPLATPHHIKSKEIKRNDIRDAVIFLHQGRMVGDVGGRNLLEVVNPPKRTFVDKIQRVTVKVIEQDKTLKLYILPKRPTDKYWGYTVHSSEATIGNILANNSDISIATSRTCQNIISLDPKKLTNKGVIITFGGPYKGLPELLKSEGKKIRDVFDYCINSLSNYGTRSLRLEEAMMITFSKLDMILPSN